MPTKTNTSDAEAMRALGGKPTLDIGRQNYSRRTSLPATDKRRNFSAGSVKEDWDVTTPCTPVAELGDMVPPDENLAGRGTGAFSKSGFGILGKKPGKPGRAR